ncbi:MAG: DUF362 domain-containing protein [Anaerolineae bacterium]
MREITRREFMSKLASLGLTTLGAGTLLTAPTCAPGGLAPAESAPAKAAVLPSEPGQAYLAVARGPDPAEITRRAIAALGGIEHFVKEGDEVIVKPNICVAYHTYEYAATTNPQVVGTLVALCLEAGAKRVRVMDFPFGGTAEEAYKRSGIEEAVIAAGGQMELMSRMKYAAFDIPEGRDIKKWDIYRDVLEADVFIDVPIAKHHGSTRLTLGMKNLMGVILERSKFHRNLGQRIADLTSLVRPTLTVVDAVRILMDHGPTGGSLDDVKKTDTVIASSDIVAADAYAATLFGMKGSDIAYIKAASEMGLGQMDLSGLKIEEIMM